MEKNFNFRSYTYNPRSISAIQFYDKNEIDLVLVPRGAIPFKLVSEISPALLPSRSETNEGVVSHNQWRVLRQLGYDQGAAGIGNSNALSAEARFTGDGRDQILANFEKIAWLGRVKVGVTLEVLYIGENDWG